MKLLIIKQKSTVLFLLTLLILFGTSNIGYAQAIDPPLSERTPQIRNAIVAAVPYVWDAEDVTAAHLAAITKLRISRKNITALKAGDFNGLTALTELHLWENSISDISPLKNLTALTELYMDNTSVSDISVLKHLTNLKVINLTNTSVSDISALDDLTSLSTLYIGGTSVSDISALDDSTNLINLDLSGTSISDISALDDLTKLSTFYLENTSISDISALDDLTNLRWLILKNNSISNISALEGLTSLTYLHLEGNSISDYDPLRRLITTIKGIEDHPGLNLDINIPPLFTEGTSTTRSVAENTASGQNIGAPVSATDVESETLTYNLSGADAASFSIISTSGQLQTRASLDFETKPSYSVTVSVSDGEGGSDSIDVRIDVTDVGENRAPSFAEGTSTTRSVAENTAANTNIGTAISATDPDTSDTLTYTLGGTDAAAFSINSTNGQLRTNAALDYETKRSYSVRITVSDTKLTSSIDVRISVSNVNEAPSFATSTATRSIAENTAANTNIGSAFTATDVDADTTLTYTLGGSDASSFSIISTNGQLQTRASLDFETKASYSVTITVSDGELTASIDVRITVTDVGENRAPTFAEGTSTTRSVAENTGSGQNIGSAVSATDPDNDTLTYTVGGTDASSFSIVSTNGQLQTRAALDFETKSSYLVTITVSDGQFTASIDVRITVTDVGENSAPTFAEGTSTTRTIAENTAANTNIGSAVSATDPNDDTLTYTLGGADAASFSINSTNGQLQTNATLDYETQKVYAVSITVSDSQLTDTIDVTINVSNVNEAPTFSAGATISNISATAGTAITSVTLPEATDVDGNTITYALSPTPPAGLIFTAATRLFAGTPTTETASASYTYTASDGTLSATLTFTIEVSAAPNNAPSFTDGTSTTRTIAENTVSDTNIGSAVAATDVDADTTLTYTLGGADAAAFSIASTSGQLQTSAALDFETKPSYSVTITVSDGELTDSIDVRIDVTDVDENSAPSFAEGTSTTRTIAENTASDTNIGSAVAATDVDADTTLTYTLGGADAAAFSIISTSGQLQTSAALDFETKPSYSVTVSVSDGNGGSDSIPVRINVTNVNEAPNFTEGSIATRTVPENKASGTNVGSPVAATDVDANTTLTYTLGGADADTFRIVSTSGQLRTNAALNFETKASYSVTVSVSDGNGGTDTIDVTINVSDVYEPIIHRTQQVQDAIVAAVPGVNHPDYVTVAHLAAITGLDIADKNITSLKSGDFNELPTLTRLTLSDNSIRDISSLEDLTTLIALELGGNNIRDISALDDLTALTDLHLQNNSISNLSALEELTNLTTLYLGSNNIRDISALDDLTKLTRLTLSNNSISNISALAGMTKLTYLILSGISISDISVLAGMTELIWLNLSYNSISDISALADLTELTTLNLSNNNIRDISALDDLTALTELDLSSNAPGNNSISDVSALEGLTALEILSLNGNPISNYDPLRKLIAAIAEIEGHLGLSLDINIPPVFTEGTDTTRSVAENTALGTNIGAPVSATDAEGDSLLYFLEGTDMESFDINNGSGQLKTLAALDFETKRSYSVTVSVFDRDGGSDSITVTIDVTDVDDNRAPAFTDGDTTTRSVAENTAAGQNIGTPVAATDADDDTLTYTLGGTDAASFSIVSTSGQLQTRAALNSQTKSSYSVTVSVSDGNGGTASITVTINVTDVPVSQRTQQVQDAIVDAVPDVWNADEVTPEHLAAITRLDIAYRGITSLKSGDFNGLTGLTWLTLEGNSISDIASLKGLTALTYLNLGGNSISDIASLKGLTALTELYLWGNSISDIAALKGLTALTYLNLENNSISNIASLKGLTALTYLNLENNSISDIAALEGLTKLTTLYLEGNPISDYDPLRKLMTAIAEIEDHPGLTLDINIPPAFTEGTSTTRSVAEYTPSHKDIGDPVSATDVDSDYLNYSLEGTDAGSFSIDYESGQLRTLAALNFATKSSYSVTISVSDDWGNTDSITVTIKVTAVNEASITPVNRRTQQVQDAIVEQVAPDAWHADEVTPAHLAAITKLSLSSKGITSLKSGDFSFLPALTELYLEDNSISNISPLSGLTALTKLNLSNNSISNIYVLRGMTKLTELNLSNNSISNISALEGLTNLRYLYLEGNPISNYDPLRKLVAAIESIEGNPRLNLDINIPPVFTEGTHTTRYVAEYTPPGQDFGAPVSATDANSSDSLNYSLEGTDADAFEVEGGTGQLQTSAALRYRTKSSYSVTVSVSDKNGGTDSINVRIYVRDVNEASITPVNRRTQQVQEAIVDEVSDVDNADDVTVAHLAAITRLDLSDEEITSLKSGDFSGLPTMTELHLSENAISDISALRGLTGLTTLYLDDNSISNISALGGLTKLTDLYLSNNSISNISALRGMTKLTNLYLSNNSISNISALEGLTKLAYLYLRGNPISDYKPLRRLKAAIEDAGNYISIDIDITNNPPQFTDGDNTTRYIAENVEYYTDIGDPILATDTDPYDSLTYDFAPDRFGDSEAASLFYIEPSSGQLQTSEDLDYETKRSYKVVVDVSDGNGGLDRITVTINIRDVAGAAPSVETSPIIPDRTALLTNFPNPFNPETWIPYQLAKPAEVTLTIYDVRGVVVRELKLGHQPAGVYHSHSRAIHWDGRNAFGEKVATGIYFYTLQAGDYTATRKLLIRK